MLQDPSIFGPVQKRGHLLSGQEPAHLLDSAERSSDPAFIVTALQGVLHLQSQPRRQMPEVDAFLSGMQRVEVLIGTDELRNIGTTSSYPPDIVSGAQQVVAMGP